MPADMTPEQRVEYENMLAKEIVNGLVAAPKGPFRDEVSEFIASILIEVGKRMTHPENFPDGVPKNFTELSVPLELLRRELTRVAGDIRAGVAPFKS